MKPIEVLIAIQARSNSTRFPKKIYEQIGDRRVLDHVIDRALDAADHIHRHTTRIKINCTVAILHPSTDDEIVRTFRSPNVIMIPGPEHDVLTRYVTAAEMTGANYVVRLTSDCPLIFPFIIAKHINCAAFSTMPHVFEGPIDYLSNVDETCRNVADGLDCEILSKRALEWLNKMATDPSDREHVTTAIRRMRPNSLRQGFVSMNLDTSEMKLSVDTPADLERIRTYYHTKEHKLNAARKAFGNSVYEL